MVGGSAADNRGVRRGSAARLREQAMHGDGSRLAEVSGTADSSCLSGTALLAALAHELRTPVTALATGSGLLLEDLDRLSRDDMVRIVQTMYRGAMWLQGLIENVLLAATLSEGAVRIYPRLLDLVELSRDIVPVIEPLLRQRSQTLRVVNRLSGARVVADGRRIGQVLVNLVSNASKFSGPGTTIEVRASRHGDRVRLSVADRGPGLPPGPTVGLFRPYARGVAAEGGSVDGAGLGLSIVKSIVDLHGGAVGATRRRGGGAIFWIDLPVAPVAALVATDDLDQHIRVRPA